ncbi:hypothetical protein PtA15_10A320 [Puccinia triticina]|uniref:Uncharacterized protein n=1 Tax=Puccinia triticina TaxID=208348 RepID=A0ABY7CUC1_9BASI|nr:uncharacterized protein PtA15_10A320 [Puccinia triticina]WAQ88898.1 hypothetical protein PtA15_10A320 [Puccinia triticina]
MNLQSLLEIDQVTLSAQRKQFLEFHLETSNPEERFYSFYNRVGLKALQAHLDALNDLEKKTL